MPLTLFITAENYQAYKVQVAAAIAGVELKVEQVKTLHDKSPTKKGPVLDTGSGLIFQSNAIMRYIARLTPATQAYGATVVASGQVDQWIDFCLNELEPARGVWLFPVLKMMDLNMRSYNSAKRDVTNVLKILNKHLNSNTYMVGHTPTIADAAIFSALLDMYSTLFSPNYIKAYKSLTRWFTTLAHNPAFASVVGEVTFATEETKAAMPKKKENKKGGNKGGKKGGNQQPKKPKVEKKKHWSQLLEKSSMNMDAEKKKFFNKKPFNADYYENMWPTFDEKGYCFYTIKYQYDDDNKEFWKTQNQVGMYVQRLDAARKYTFGTMMILGETEESAPWNVWGCFMYRGVTAAQEHLDVPDSEYYTFEKLDVSTDAGKALVKEFFQGEEVQGKKILDRRFFK